MLKRTGFKRPDPRTLDPFKRSTLPRRSGPIKKKAPKKRAGHDKAMLAACRGQPCYLRVPGVCRNEIATVVPCHANWAEYGKGMGQKAADRFTVPGCWRCHSWLDQGPAPGELKRATWEAAYSPWSAYRDGVPREAA
ncbi:DUF1364 family protein [Robbsia sp. Bb-Pol-6]|uniref:DUF1364 family protein n=1 Tax=Robbsia betulipollinis TaxID=2981849 RepID=A0ABT3ZSU7_9BURK|nr:nuclease domain-containing protein [Robbsia betulipollinis]MCY0389616.1 DUF1364 family protein [Robbsia betulipollinis]